MKKQDENDRELLRINNMPLLSFKISNDKEDVLQDNYFVTNCSNDKSVNFKLKIKNSGMNAIKKIIYKIFFC